MSLIDLVAILERRLGRKIPLKWQDWRPGDRRIYVSDIRKLEKALDWKPLVNVEPGVAQLADWVKANRMDFEPSGTGMGLPPMHPDATLEVGVQE